MDRQKDFTINEEKFAGLSNYVDELHNLGMHFIIILDPAINAEVISFEVINGKFQIVVLNFEHFWPVTTKEYINHLLYQYLSHCFPHIVDHIRILL